MKFCVKWAIELLLAPSQSSDRRIDVYVLVFGKSVIKTNLYRLQLTYLNTTNNIDKTMLSHKNADPTTTRSPGNINECRWSDIRVRVTQVASFDHDDTCTHRFHCDRKVILVYRHDRNCCINLIPAHASVKAVLIETLSWISKITEQQYRNGKANIPWSPSPQTRAIHSSSNQNALSQLPYRVWLLDTLSVISIPESAQTLTLCLLLSLPTQRHKVSVWRMSQT